MRTYENSCKGKRKIWPQKLAQRLALHYQTRFGGDLKVAYRCRFCEFFHLGTAWKHREKDRCEQSCVQEG